MRTGLIVALCTSAIHMAGCALPPDTIKDRSDYVAEQTHMFPGETRERVLKAAEEVIAATDSGNFEFHYGLNGFSARRPYFVYAGLGSAFGREKWDLNTEPVRGGIRASLSVSDAGDIHGGLSLARYEDVSTSAPVYRLFWSRVEYMLGRRPDYVTCDEARTWSSGAGGSLHGLCGAKRSLGNLPTPLPKIPSKRSTPYPSAAVFDPRS